VLNLSCLIFLAIFLLKAFMSDDISRQKYNDYIGIILLLFFPFLDAIQIFVEQLAQIQITFGFYSDFINFSLSETENYGINKKSIKCDEILDGEIQFKNFSLRYGESKILDTINLRFNIGERILICGRSGSGKSSLVNSIFNFHLVKETEGQIYIGNCQNVDYSLKNLRSNIAFVSQDPFLFLETVRKNVDPQSLHTDEEIYVALQKLGLLTKVQNMPAGLDTFLNQNLLSSSEKQTFCLARAILKKAKIIVFDEITATLDSEAVKIVSNLFLGSDVTVLNIAHHVSDFLHFDRVIIMDKGMVIEDKPIKDALENPQSHFQKFMHKK